MLFSGTPGADEEEAVLPVTHLPPQQSPRNFGNKTTNQYLPGRTRKIFKMSATHYGFVLLVVFVVCFHIYEVCLIYYSSLPIPNLSSMEVTLEPSFAMRVQGEKKRRTSWMTSFDIKHARCSYFYQSEAAGIMQYGGDIVVQLSTTANQYNAELYSENTQFGILRSIVWDVYKNDDATSLVSVNCSIGLKVDWLFSVSTYHNIERVETFKIAAFSYDSNLESANRFRVSNTQFELNKIKADVTIDIQNYIDQLFAIQPSVEQFIIHFPTVEYAMTLLDRGDAENCYMYLHTNSMTWDLANKGSDLTFSLLIGGTSNNNKNAQDEACVLFQSLNVRPFTEELLLNHFLNVTAHSNANNFVSLLLGEQHFIRSSAAMPMYKSYSDEMGRTQNGMNCLVVDVNGVYHVQGCHAITHNMFHVSAAIYDVNDIESGSVHFNVKKTESENDHNFDTELYVKMASCSYQAKSKLAYSAQSHNMELLFEFITDKHTVLSENFTSSWMHEPNSASFSVHSKSVTAITQWSPIQLIIDIKNQAFTITVQGNSALRQYAAIEMATASGSYDLSSNQFDIKVNNVKMYHDGNVVSTASSTLTIAAPGSWPNNQIIYHLQVFDNSQQAELYSIYGKYYWYSSSNWKKDGHIISTVHLVNNKVMVWDGSVSIYYDDKSYLFGMQESKKSNPEIENSRTTVGHFQGNYGTVGDVKR